MKKLFCDRCHKEIKASWWSGLAKTLTLNFNEFEICSICWNSFNKWFDKK